MFSCHHRHSVTILLNVQTYKDVQLFVNNVGATYEKYP